MMELFAAVVVLWHNSEQQRRVRIWAGNTGAVQRILMIQAGANSSNGVMKSLLASLHFPLATQERLHRHHP